MEHIRPKSNLGYKLKIHCSFGIFDIFEVIAKTSFSKNAKCSSLAKSDRQKLIFINATPDPLVTTFYSRNRNTRPWQVDYRPFDHRRRRSTLHSQWRLRDDGALSTGANAATLNGFFSDGLRFFENISFSRKNSNGTYRHEI